jgi:sulfoxide reductase heme-binding subunit YedZ
MSSPRIRGLEGWAVVGWTTVVLAIVGSAVFQLFGTDAEGWRMQIRGTARISGALFLAAFLAAPLRRLAPNDATAWLLRNRRALGVSVGVVHAGHGVAIARYVALSGHETPTATLVAALLAYGFLAAMVATSFDATAAALGRRNWRRLHRTGLYYLWLVFGFTFGGSAAAGDPVSTGYALAYLLALPVRLLGLRGRRLGAMPGQA